MGSKVGRYAFGIRSLLSLDKGFIVPQKGEPAKQCVDTGVAGLCHFQVGVPDKRQRCL